MFYLNQYYCNKNKNSVIVTKITILTAFSRLSNLIVRKKLRITGNLK